MADNNSFGATQNYQGDEHSSSSDAAPPPGDVPEEHPERIGRYRIENVLGKGGFGLVYLAQDEQLDRLVANKVPHANLISKPEDAQAYLAEARTVANLDQGSTDEFPCYVVSSNSRTRRRIGCCVTLNRCAGNQYLGRETR